MYPSNVKFVSDSAGLIDNDLHVVVAVDASTPLDASIDRELLLTLSIHYTTVTVVLKKVVEKAVVSDSRAKTFADDDARPTCDEDDCTCESCVSTREWEENYDSNAGVLKK